jgi:hypothetical protein
VPPGPPTDSTGRAATHKGPTPGFLARSVRDATLVTESQIAAWYKLLGRPGLRVAARRCPLPSSPAAALSLAVAFAALAPGAQGSTFDHSAFDALLKAHVVDGMVDYDAFMGPEFAAYLKSLAAAKPESLDEKERLALWINAYNAYTIQLINSHEERDSIRNINKTLFIKAKGPWKEELAKVGGEDYNLDNIEHDIIRKQFDEPRIHFALVCAAMGCPPLRSEAYTGARLDAQLQDQSEQFLVHTPSKNRVDVAKRTVYGSMIYVKYYREDFGDTDEAIGKYLAGFYPEGPEKQLLLSGDFELEQTDYDWTLNSQEKARELQAKGKKK